MDKYSVQYKNQLFSKIQEYVKDEKLTLQNMVDLHDIFITDKPSYSHNKSGTMYMAAKYSDETFEKIEELLKWVEKQHPIELTLQQEEGVSTMLSDETNIEPDTNDDQSQLQKVFGENKKFKNTFGGGRFKLLKVADVTKTNEVFKRIIKKSKKRASIPIHHQEKDLTSWEDSFNHKRNCHFSEYYMSRNVNEDENEEEGEDYVDSVEDEEEEEEEEVDLLYEQFGEEEEEELEEASVEIEEEEEEDLGDDDGISD
jgi:hypothetical protein